MNQSAPAFPSKSNPCKLWRDDEALRLGEDPVVNCLS